MGLIHVSLDFHFSQNSHSRHRNSAPITKMFVLIWCFYRKKVKDETERNKTKYDTLGIKNNTPELTLFM